MALSKDIRIAALESAYDGLGIYVMSSIDKDGKTTDRTPWQDGWNAAVMAGTEAVVKFEEWFRTLDSVLAGMIAELCIENVASLDTDDDGKIHITVNANDLFYWACADAEDLPLEEVRTLYDMHRKDPHRRGSEKWCCRRRKMRPQTPIEKEMREEGSWDEELEALPYRDPKGCG